MLKRLAIWGLNGLQIHSLRGADCKSAPAGEYQNKNILLNFYHLTNYESSEYS